MIALQINAYLILWISPPVLYLNFFSHFKCSITVSSIFVIAAKKNIDVKSPPFVSHQFDCNGGEINIEEHAVKVTVPRGAIADDQSVEFQITASLFGPFTVPKGYHPISAFVTIEACYKFHKNIEIQIEHHACVESAKDISKLCLLRTCQHEHSEKQQTMHEVVGGYKYEVDSSFCKYFADHFCSVCCATKSECISNRVMAFHFLPHNFNSADSVKAEVCFCYNLVACRNRAIEVFEKRNMIKKDLCLIKNAFAYDELLLSVINKKGDWSIVVLQEKIDVKDVDFRELCTCEEDLLFYENEGIYPPRCIVQLNRHEPSTLDVYYALNLQNEQKKEEVCKFNVFIKETGHNSAQSSSNLLPSMPSEQLIEQKPSMQDIITIVVPRIMAEWQNVGFCLSIDQHTIEAIEKDHKYCETCCKNLLKRWLCTSHNPTWKRLIDGIKKLKDLTAAAEGIETDLCRMQNN